MQRFAGILGAFVLLLGILAAPAQASSPAQAASPDQAAPPQFRAYWVDAFGPGIYNPAEIDKLIADVKAAHLNAIVA